MVETSEKHTQKNVLFINRFFCRSKRLIQMECKNTIAQHGFEPLTLEN